MCADYTVVKVEPPTPSPLCYKYSCARAHTLLWTNSLFKDISQVRQGELGNERDKGNGGMWVTYYIRACINVKLLLLFCKTDQLGCVPLNKIKLPGIKGKIR